MLYARIFPNLQSAQEFAATHDCWTPGLQEIPGVGVWGTEQSIFPVYAASGGVTPRCLVYEYIDRSPD